MIKCLVSMKPRVTSIFLFADMFLNRIEKECMQFENVKDNEALFTGATSNNNKMAEITMS